MNDSQQTPPFPICSPRVFEAWVCEVATINEQFSEVMHNSADILAVNDPQAAMGLYQAADVAHCTAHRLRLSIPTATSSPTFSPAPLAKWIGLGVLCGYLLSFV
jgi:hypothetical protein